MVIKITEATNQNHQVMTEFFCNFVMPKKRHPSGPSGKHRKRTYSEVHWEAELTTDSRVCCLKGQQLTFFKKFMRETF